MLRSGAGRQTNVSEISLKHDFRGSASCLDFAVCSEQQNAVGFQSLGLPWFLHFTVISRARGLPRKPLYCNAPAVFDTCLISCERVADDDLKLQYSLQPLTLGLHFVQEGCRRTIFGRLARVTCCGVAADQYSLLSFFLARGLLPNQIETIISPAVCDAWPERAAAETKNHNGPADPLDPREGCRGSVEIGTLPQFLTLACAKQRASTGFSGSLVAVGVSGVVVVVVGFGGGGGGGGRGGGGGGGCGCC